jgi:hypothetical protein
VNGQKRDEPNESGSRQFRPQFIEFNQKPSAKRGCVFVFFFFLPDYSRMKKTHQKESVSATSGCALLSACNNVRQN